MIYTT